MSGNGRSEAVCERVLAVVAAHTGLVFPASRRPFAEQGIQRAMAKMGHSDDGAYLDGLVSGAVRLDGLVDELTVGETYFFREPDQFEFIRHEALPAIRQLRPAPHTLRAWSAGCASGEEAYSLAILFDEEGIADQSHVLATDISPAALARARSGSYGAWSFRGDAERRTQRYLQRHGRRRVVLDRLRDRVTFRGLNLAADLYPSAAAGTAGLDLILCRNVLIYLDPATVRRVARRLFRALADGGWLITGPSDPPLPEDAGVEAVMTSAGVVYRRGHQARPVAPPVAGSGIQTRGRAPAAAESAPPRRPSVNPRPASDPIDDAQGAFVRGAYARVVDLTEGRLADPAACMLRVRALANLGEAGLADEAASTAVNGHPLHPELHFLRAVVLLGQGRRDEAMQSLRKVLYLDPNLALAHLTLGSILQQDGALSEARRAFRSGLARLAARPPGEIVPLSDGERAGSLADAARVHLAYLEAAPEHRP